MKVVVAYSGSPAASAAVASLVGQGLEVVTLTLDIGQSEPLDGIRARALSSGAVRAHVVDAREAFVRTCVLPAMLASGTADVDALMHPLIAKTLGEVATIEGAEAIPHTPPPPATTAADPRERHLLTRPSVHPSRAPETDARLDLTLENGIPVAVNDVPMSLVELVESLSLIAGQHGIGYDEAVHTPAAVILRAVYATTPDASTTVRLTLGKGTYTVQPSDAAVVTHS